MVDGERIAAVAPRLPEDGAAVVDAPGKFLMPGMIDSHVHATLFGEEGLLTYARLGVTTVKDLGGAFEQAIALRDRSRAGEVAGARVACVGAFVEGDPPAWGPGAFVSFSGMEVHRTEAEIDRTVERNMAAGVDGIKLYAGLPPRLVAHAVRRIAKRVPITGHLTATTAGEAVAAGVDGLEHLMLTLYRDLATADHALAEGDTMSNIPYWGKVRRGWEAIDPRGDAARRIAAAMADASMRMIPTLVLGRSIHTEFTHEEESAFTAPQRERMAARRSAASGAPPTPDLRPSADNMIAMTETLHAAGVPVLPGTDCGAVTVPPGYGYHIELELLAQAMPAHDVLMAATSRAAAWLRRDDLGVIAPGKRADLALIDGDPLRDITEARQVAGAWVAGQRVD
jgi:imidazolonepropionase-like amidohydrolase